MFKPCDRIDFMSLVRNNDLNALISKSIAEVSLEDFEQAYQIMNENNPNWRSLCKGEVLRGYMEGLEYKIKELKGQPHPSFEP